MQKRMSTIALIAVFILGLSLLLYPTLSDYWNSMTQSHAISGYAEAVAGLDNDAYQVMLQQAQQYNSELLKNSGRYLPDAVETARYNSLLRVSSDGAMGYIEIPIIQCTLPVYHGASDDVLQVAIGHIAGSSLPVGGESTHTVLSGHRGLPSAKLFSNLDKLKEGDTFMLHILDETLTYEVDQILIVLPEEVDALDIVLGKDYCTLVTCTPYGINTHRMLVRGHRTDNIVTGGEIRVTADAMQIDSLLVAPIVAVPMLAVLLVWLLAKDSKSKKKNRIHKEQ